MRLVLLDDDGQETISVHHIYMLAGRLDWTDSKGDRNHSPIPHEFQLDAATTDGLYVRVDRPHYTRVGYANEVRLDRNFFGHPELTIDGCVVVPDAGFTLYVSELRSAAKEKLKPFAST